LVVQALSRLGNGAGSASEAGSALRRAFLLSFHDLSRLSLGQPDTILDIRRFMDDGRSLIINLGNIPDAETRRLIGALLLVHIEQAALSRTDLPLSHRRPWTVLVDEWASMAASADTLSSILDQTRKMGLRLYLASQSTAQVGSDRLTGALENCRLTVAFGLGRESALEQGKQLATPVREEAAGLLSFLFPPVHPSTREQTQVLTDVLQVLGPREAYVKRAAQPPLKVRTLAVPDASPDAHALAVVLATYRERYQRTTEEAQRRSQQAMTWGRPSEMAGTVPRAFEALFAEGR
jgi:hypothetical protein